MKILLFEDTKEKIKKIQKAIESNLPKNIECIVFTKDKFKTKFDDKKTYEENIIKELKHNYYNDVLLIVCDRDLSKVDSYRGLSEVNVSSAALKLGIPVCLYASGLNTRNVLIRQREWGNGRIVLKDYPKDKKAAREIYVLAKGFIELRKNLDNLFEEKSNGQLPPLEIFSKLLKHPEYSVQISLYDNSNQKLISDIHELKNKSDKNQQTELNRKYSCLFGYWLYDSIIRFPGLLLNEIAAASYFDISQKEFNKKNIRKLFNFALYKGPFSDDKNPLWWRGLVDNHLLSLGYKKALELAEAKLSKKIGQCYCSVDGKKNAGYYCIVTNKPISFENSYGNYKFFPRGANLTRISKNKYEEDGPWVDN